MARRDMAQIAQRSPALKDLVILSMPDCIFVDGWSAHNADTETFAALMGTVVHAVRQTTQATDGRASAEMVTIETPDALIFVVPIGTEFAAGFVFTRRATIGLARLQIRDALLDIEPLLRRAPVPTKPPPAVPMPTTLGDDPLASIDSIPESVPAIRAPSRPPAATSEPPTERPAPANEPSPQPPEDHSIRARALRLLQHLQRHAPDPHVSLLRLSLRTGIAMERLDRPETLSEEQVEAMAASVRDIIGQGHLGT